VVFSLVLKEGTPLTPALFPLVGSNFERGTCWWSEPESESEESEAELEDCALATSRINA